MSSIVIALISAISLVSLGDLRSNVPQAITILLAWGAVVWVLPRPKLGIGWLVGVALVLRLLLVASPVSLSDDVYRYLWEGYVAWAGENPYAYSPADPHWDTVGPTSLRDAVAHGQVSAIYPPLSIWFFGLLSQFSTEAWWAKLCMGMVDVAVVWLLAQVLMGRGRHLGPAWLYALHPLGAVESAGSGHMEPLAIACVLAAILSWDRKEGGSAWAALGMWIKILPGVLLLRLWPVRPGLLSVALAVGVLALWPFLDAGMALFSGLGVYAQRWSFNGGLFLIFDAVFGHFARPVVVVVGALIVLRAVRLHKDPARIALWAGGTFVLLSPTVHPWYVLWAWVPALLCGVRSWTILATLTPLSYVALASYDSTTSSWEEAWWPPLFSTLPFLMALIWEFVHHLTQPGPWAPGPMERLPRSVSRTEPDTSTLFQR
jgi:hypothetical protein